MSFRDSWDVWREKVNKAIGIVSEIFLNELDDVNITNPSAGEVLTYDAESEDWVNEALPTIPDDLSELNDIEIDTPTDGQVLTFDNTDSKWKNESLPTIPDELSELNDIEIDTPTDGQVLTFDDTDNKWKNESLPTIPQGTVTSVEAGTGLTGGTITETGTLAVDFGNASGKVCEGNDSRLSDSRTPVSHATDSTTYGGGTGSNYGHVKLSDTYNSLVGDASASIGASQKGLNELYKITPKHATTTKNFTATTLNSLADVTVDTGLSSNYYGLKVNYCSYSLLPYNIYTQSGTWRISFKNIYGFTVTLSTSDSYTIEYLYN